MANYDPQLRTRLTQLGERLREQRCTRGLSQEEIAHLAGLHRTYIGSVERGERNISVGSLYTIADALGVSASALIPD